MANLISYANGNITGTTTFKSEAAGSGATLTTASPSSNTSLTSSYQYSTAFTVTAGQTIEGVLVCFRRNNNTEGTLSVALSDDGGTTATREVSINNSDISDYSNESTNSFVWVFAKFGSTLASDGGADYKVGLKTSAGSVQGFTDGTAANWLHVLRISTTATAAAADNLYIVGEWTSAATSTTFTVTMNDTASTDYGQINVSSKGTLTFGTAAATNYTLKTSGVMYVQANGTLNIGTTGTPIPRGSTAQLLLDCTSNVEFGLIIGTGGTLNAQGLSRTSGKDIYYCKLNTDEAAAQTVLGVDTDTGWLDGDVIAIASTTRTASECESATLSGAAGASSITITSGITNAHSGTSPTQAEVILLTRSIVIQGASTSNQGYIWTSSTSSLDVDWVEFKWLGSAAANKRGIELGNTTGSFNIQYSSLHDFSVASSLGITANGTSGSHVYSNNVSYNIANLHFNMSVNTYSSFTYSNCIHIRNTDAAPVASIAGCLVINSSTMTISNIVVAGGAGTSGMFTGFRFGSSSSTESFSGSTISDLTSHSNAGSNFCTAAFASNISASTVNSWRSNQSGFDFQTNTSGSCAKNITITNGVFFGNNSSNIRISNNVHNLVLISPTLSGDTTFSTTTGLLYNGSYLATGRIISGDFSTVSGIKTAHTSEDISTGANNSAGTQLILVNTKLGASTEVSNQAWMSGLADFLGSQKTDQTAGNHKTWKKYGTITVDTTANMFRTASPSERLTPNNASNKLISGTKQIAVANGATLTPSVYVRESVAGDGTDYNGNRARLVLKRNDAIGITSDTVIDTATASSEGAFEQLTGTTAAATDDGVMEFYVDCDGTTGWLNVDDWSVS